MCTFVHGKHLKMPNRYFGVVAFHCFDNGCPINYLGTEWPVVKSSARGSLERTGCPEAKTVHLYNHKCVRACVCVLALFCDVRSPTTMVILYIITIIAQNTIYLSARRRILFGGVPFSASSFDDNANVQY